MTDNEQRQNPYQLVFGAESIDDRLFPPIAEEAEARDQPLDDPDRFLFLSSVGQLLQAIAEPDPYQGRHVAEGREDRPPVAGLEDERPASGRGGPPTDDPFETRDPPRAGEELGAGQSRGAGHPMEGGHPADAERPAEPGQPSEFGQPREVGQPSEFGQPTEPGQPREPGPAIEAGEQVGFEEARESLAGASEAGDASTSQASDDALKQYGRLLYHAFHYWREQKPTRRVDEDGLRWLLDEVTSVGEWTLSTPTGSGYLQLPKNLVWAEPAPGLTPEPVDGFFWRFTEPEDEPAHLHVLLVLGVRPDRAGFSVVPATGVLDTERHWAEIDARTDGPDFETKLPGGDMEALYSIETAAEVLKLASLCFWKLDPAAG